MVRWAMYMYNSESVGGMVVGISEGLVVGDNALANRAYCCYCKYSWDWLSVGVGCAKCTVDMRSSVADESNPWGNEQVVRHFFVNKEESLIPSIPQVVRDCLSSGAEAAETVCEEQVRQITAHAAEAGAVTVVKVVGTLYGLSEELYSIVVPRGAATAATAAAAAAGGGGEDAEEGMADGGDAGGSAAGLTDSYDVHIRSGMEDTVRLHAYRRFLEHWEPGATASTGSGLPTTTGLSSGPPLLPGCVLYAWLRRGPDDTAYTLIHAVLPDLPSLPRPPVDTPQSTLTDKVSLVMVSFAPFGGVPGPYALSSAAAAGKRVAVAACLQLPDVLILGGPFVPRSQVQELFASNDRSSAANSPFTSPGGGARSGLSSVNASPSQQYLPRRSVPSSATAPPSQQQQRQQDQLPQHQKLPSVGMSVSPVSERGSSIGHSPQGPTTTVAPSQVASLQSMPRPREYIVQFLQSLLDGLKGMRQPSGFCGVRIILVPAVHDSVERPTCFPQAGSAVLQAAAQHVRVGLGGKAGGRVHSVRVSTNPGLVTVDGKRIAVVTHDPLDAAWNSRGHGRDANKKWWPAAPDARAMCETLLERDSLYPCLPGKRIVWSMRGDRVPVRRDRPELLRLSQACAERGEREQQESSRKFPHVVVFPRRRAGSSTVAYIRTSVFAMPSERTDYTLIALRQCAQSGGVPLQHDGGARDEAAASRGGRAQTAAPEPVVPVFDLPILQNQIAVSLEKYRR